MISGQGSVASRKVLMRMNGVRLIGMVGGVLIASTAFGQVIRLESQAVVVRGQDVRLGNVATIKGVDEKTGASLAEMVIMSGVETNKKISAESVLMAIASQLGQGGITDQLQVSGAAEVEIVVSSDGTAPVEVKQAAPAAVVCAAPAAAADAEQTVVTANVDGATPSTSPPATTQTLSQIIMDNVGQESGLGAEDYRVMFDTVNSLLDQNISTGKWQVRAMTRTMVGTIPFSAELVDGPRVLQRLIVQTRVEKRVVALCAASELPSGTVITKEHLQTQEEWLDRDIPTLFTNEKDILGLEAQREIVAGSMLDQRDFKPAVMAERGDSVTVIFLSGSLKVQMCGRAMANGKLHDLITVESETPGENGQVTKQDYQVKLIGKCLAVVGDTLSEAEEKKLRETR
jgi:flagella basal body P-ring formation protein FlgA